MFKGGRLRLAARTIIQPRAVRSRQGCVGARQGCSVARRERAQQHSETECRVHAQCSKDHVKVHAARADRTHHTRPDTSPHRPRGLAQPRPTPPPVTSSEAAEPPCPWTQRARRTRNLRSLSLPLTQAIGSRDREIIWEARHEPPTGVAADHSPPSVKAPKPPLPTCLAPTCPMCKMPAARGCVNRTTLPLRSTANYVVQRTTATARSAP